jgi:hypothetical protein
LDRAFSRCIFDGGSDARTALDDAVRHGNNPYRCACPGSDVRSTLPGLHAGLQQRRQLHRVWLYIDGSVCSVGVRPRSSVLRQPIFCAYRQESVAQGPIGGSRHAHQGDTRLAKAPLKPQGTSSKIALPVLRQLLGHLIPPALRRLMPKRFESSAAASNTSTDLEGSSATVRSFAQRTSGRNARCARISKRQFTVETSRRQRRERGPEPAPVGRYRLSRLEPRAAGHGSGHACRRSSAARPA